jgi:hypothetical protein
MVGSVAAVAVVSRCVRVCAFALMCSAAYVLAHSFGAALGCVVAKEGTFVVERCRYEAWSGAAVRQR